MVTAWQRSIVESIVEELEDQSIADDDREWDGWAYSDLTWYVSLKSATVFMPSASGCMYLSYSRFHRDALSTECWVVRPPLLTSNTIGPIPPSIMLNIWCLSTVGGGFRFGGSG